MAQTRALNGRGGRPFRRARSRILRVPALDPGGKPITLEVQTEEWLNAKTGRYRRVWSARQVDRLGWDTSSSLREALRRAAYVPAGARPAWLTDAVRRARTLS